LDGARLDFLTDNRSPAHQHPTSPGHCPFATPALEKSKKSKKSVGKIGVSSFFQYETRQWEK
jgi:hypothetical protein